MMHLFKRFSQFSLGTFLGALIALIQVPILTHFLLPEEYGQAGLFRTLITQLPLFLYLGLDQSYSREYHNYKDKSYLVKNSMIIPLINSAILLIIAIIFDDQLSVWLFASSEYKYIIWVSSIWMFFLILERFILLTIRMEDMAKEYSFFTLLTKVNAFIISMLLIVIGMDDFRVVVFGLIFGQLIADIILILKYKHYITFEYLNFDFYFIKQMLAFGIPQMIAITLTSALNAVDNIFINNNNNPIDLGIYNVGLSIVSIIGIIRTAFNTFWLPTAYKWETMSKSIDHYKVVSDVLLLVLTNCFYILLIMKPLITLVIGDKYHSVVTIIGILTLPHILATLSETTTLGILFSRKTHLNIFVGLATFITSLLFNSILTPFFGYKGAALASALAYCMYYFARTYFSKSTGFYFRQNKQIISVFLMLMISILHVIEVPYLMVYTIIFGMISIISQKSTFKELIDIQRNPDNWNFN